MLLVIFIHVSAEAVTGYIRSSAPFWILCSAQRLASFVVQGFLFLSGLKLFLGGQNAGRDDFSYPRFLWSRVRRVVLPYLLVFSVFYLYFILTGRITPSPAHFFTECFTGGLTAHFYFVAIICQFYLLPPLWRLIVRKADPVLTLLVSLFVMLILRTYLPELCRVLFGYELTLNSRIFTTYLFYFIAGCYAGTYYRAFTRFLLRRCREIWVLTAVAGAIDCVLICVIENRLYYPYWADTFHVLYCILAILTVLSLALRFREKDWMTSKLMMLADRASYNVYLIHPLFLFLSISLLNRAGITSLTVRFLCEAVFTYLFSLGLCLGWEAFKLRLKHPTERI